MSTIVQLSDLHLGGHGGDQNAILDALEKALRADRELRGKRADLLTITGDLFDSATLDVHDATERYAALHRRFRDALGGDVPTVIVPGNHDRRRSGLFGPHREALFDALRDRLGKEAWVHGCTAPFLSAVVPPELHGQPLWVLAYDSTYLPHGLMSAGGMMRQEDLLYAASVIGDRNPDWPVLFLMHHHLVPTPLTDMGKIEADQAPRAVQWLIYEVLPKLVAHGDREELTMTALGAGTALSTLHALDRAVLVLHGHKHYATARLLDGMREGHGDVLIVSAGSAGTAQTWGSAKARDTARLWPSFNVLELEGDELKVETVSFGYKGSSTAKLVRRPLVRAERRGSQWIQQPIPKDDTETFERRLALNEAIYRLTPSPGHVRQRWDYECERRVTRSTTGRRLSRYVEAVEGIDGARLVILQRERPGKRNREVPTRLDLDLDRVTQYRVEAAVCRNFNDVPHTERERSSPFEWLELLNRYGSEKARVEVQGLGELERHAFASVTDVGTGLESPATIRRLPEGGVAVEMPNCPPRTLLRIYWPLETNYRRRAIRN